MYILGNLTLNLTGYIYIYIGRPFDYKGGHFGSNPNRGFIKGHLRPEEYQYGPDEIPFILYS